MRNAALFGCLGIGSLVAVASCEPVDDGAATRAQGWNRKLTDHVLPGDRAVFVDVNETVTVPELDNSKPGAAPEQPTGEEPGVIGDETRDERCEQDELGAYRAARGERPGHDEDGSGRHGQAALLQHHGREDERHVPSNQQRDEVHSDNMEHQNGMVIKLRWMFTGDPRREACGRCDRFPLRPARAPRGSYAPSSSRARAGGDA